MSPPFDLLPPLLAGLVVTLKLTGAAAALATAIALAAGIARVLAPRPLAIAVRVYVEVFRGTSALVQLFWVYFALPLVDIELDAFTAGVLVLALNTGAYGAEVVRGAIEAVPRGQWQAARALGLSRPQALLHVALPQASVSMLPPAGNLLVELVKATALVSLITIEDLTFRGQTLRAATLRSAEIYAWILVLYFVAATTLAKGVTLLERRLGRGWRVGRGATA